MIYKFVENKAILLYIFGIFTYVCTIYLYALHGIAEKIVINCVINCWFRSLIIIPMNISSMYIQRDIWEL